MNQFYVSIIFMGIILIMVALVWIAVDWKKSSDEKKIVDKKRNEIAEMVSGADQMIDEMNRFSDYIADFMQTKSEYIENKVKEVEAKLEDIEKIIEEKQLNLINESEKTGTDDVAKEVVNINYKAKKNNDIKEKTSNKNQDDNRTDGDSGEGKKVILLSPKSREVAALAKEGLSETEIAKRLNIGKGEVQLILGIKK